MEYSFHEYCLLFPQADESTLASLSNDVRENGLNEPIILYEGKILDGRNRYLACQMAQIEPSFKEYTGDEPLQFVVSKNLHRRHLNESQRAMLAQKIWKMSKGNVPLTQAEVRDQFKVGKSSIRKAARVDELAIDDIKKKVEDGTLSLNKAADVIKKAKKVAGVKEATTGNKEVVAKIKEAQTKIMNDEVDDVDLPVNATAKEFNDNVLSGVYDGKRYRNDVQKIQSIIAEMETLPTLFEDAISVVGTLEQEKMLMACVDMMANSVRRAESKFQLSSVSYDEVLSIAADLLNNRFKLPEFDQSDERDLLEELKAQYLNDCAAFLKDADALKKRVRNGGKFDDDKKSDTAENSDSDAGKGQD